MKKFFKVLFTILLILILLAAGLIAAVLMVAPAENRAEALKEMSDFASSKLPVTAQLDRPEPAAKGPAEIPLLDEGGIRVTITSVEDKPTFALYAPLIRLRVENHTDSTKHVMAAFAVLNGYQFDNLLSATVEPGETLEDVNLRLSSGYDYMEYGFTSLDELTVWFNILDEDYERYIIPMATAKLSGGGSEAAPLEECGTVAVDRDGVKVVFLDTLSADGQYAYVYASNTSREYYLVDLGDVLVNGRPLSGDAVWVSRLWMLPDTRIVSRIPIDISGEAVREITASVDVLRRTTFTEEEQGEPVAQSGPVTAPLHAREVPDPYAGFEHAVIARQDGITVTATGFRRLEDRLGEVSYELYFSVENDTGKEIFVDSEDIYLDHCGCYCSCSTADGDVYFPVPAHGSEKGVLKITPKLADYGMDRDPQTADCQLYYRTVREEYGRGAGTVHHHLDCSEIALVPQAVPVSPEPFGKKLFSSRGVDFYLLELMPYDNPIFREQSVLNMLVVNNSDTDLWIVNGKATKVNGEQGRIVDLGSFDENVPAGGFCLARFTADGPASELETLEFRLELRDLYSAETAGKTRTARITFR